LALLINDFRKFKNIIVMLVSGIVSTILGLVVGSVIPEDLGLSITISRTFLALLINDLRKFKNIIVMLVSGIVATIGYNTIPFQAYIIVAAIAALLIATLLTLITLKKN
jgi:predicted branched-subunit amino acid permease